VSNANLACYICVSICLKTSDGMGLTTELE
jgi:hypothetical protein